MSEQKEVNGVLQKLKSRWGVNSSWDVLVILLVFACTGFSILFLKRILFGITGLDGAATWIRWGVNIVVILPLYQVILLAWGWIWGKYDFFYAFIHRMIQSMRKWVRI